MRSHLYLSLLSFLFIETIACAQEQVADNASIKRKIIELQTLELDIKETPSHKIPKETYDDLVNIYNDYKKSLESGPQKELPKPDFSVFISSLKEKKSEFKGKSRKEVKKHIKALADKHVDQSQFDSPIKVGSYTFQVHKATAEAGTPTKEGNVLNMLDGKAPYFKNPETGEQDKANAHHVTQSEDDTVYVIPKSMHNAHHGVLHPFLGSPSEIDRTEFSVVRGAVYKIRGIRTLITYLYTCLTGG